MRIYTVNKNDSNQRLDKFIQKTMPKLPKSMLYKGLRKNNVRINGKHCHDGNVVVNEGDTISLYFNDKFFKSNEKILSPLPSPIVVYEDENILVLDKPKGLSVHADEKESDDTLIDRVIYYLFEKGEYKPQEENTFTPSLCNRLDKNTSGLVIGAKNANALRL